MVDPSPSLAANPDLDRWLTVSPDGTVLVRSGKVELGQGILTALAQIVADELGVDIARVRVLPARTGESPNEGYTAGSMSIQHSGTALRHQAARLRAAALAAAADQLGTDQLTIVDGEIKSPHGTSTTYWALAGRLLDHLPAAADPIDTHTAVGRNVPRIDIPGKTTGIRRYIHDLRLPGQLFGRVLRPPGRAAHLLDVTEAPVRALPGVVTVVRDGDFLGVVAADEYTAVRAVELLAETSRWTQHPSLPDQPALADYLTTAPADTHVLHDTGTPVTPTIHARFTRPYLAHASIAPSCAIARWDDDTLSVWSHTQGVYHLRAELARWFGLPLDQIQVEHVEGAGCYGHNGADDVAGDAALLARAVSVSGRPVQVVWSRPDELGWAPFGPAMVVDVSVALDADGTLRHWRQEIWGNGHSSRPSSGNNPPLLAALHTGRQSIPSGDPPPAAGNGSARNAIPGYHLPGLTVVTHVLREMPLRTSALRSLGAHLNVYAIESVVDELAARAGVDPIEYRLRMLPDPRGRAVLERVARASGWGAPVAEDHGRGVGYARYKNTSGYCAVVADVEATSAVRVTALTIAVDVGQVVNPDGVRNQIEGGAVQSVSWTTKEQVRFDRHDVTSRTWQDYPILTFSEVPPVRVELVDRPDLPPLGAGEVASGPTAAAIGNAVRAALGVAVRTLPLTSDNVIAALP